MRHKGLMKRVRLFPDGKIHSIYLDMVRYPAKDIEYIGLFEYSPGSALNIDRKNSFRSMADYFMLPYVFNLTSDCFIHSCQKLIHTKSDYVIDIEHGNPFGGYSNIWKCHYQPFRFIVKKLLLKDNCKHILPWSYAAKGAFCHNYGFLGNKFLYDKVDVIYPATAKCESLPNRFNEFTFLFVAGQSFYAKGGLAVLEAFSRVNYIDKQANLIIVGDIPDYIKIKYHRVLGISFYDHMPRANLLDLMSCCHVLLFPSTGDTFGMTLLEAKARGLPAIVVDSFSAKEIVENGKTGIVLKPDSNIELWFDGRGCKRFNKDIFHNQFFNYKPSDRHIDDLKKSMMVFINERNTLKRMSDGCLRDIDNGKFSIDYRNKALAKAYGV
jgi:glycosyltransferase involved in cell wall biosynthesis